MSKEWYKIVKRAIDEPKAKRVVLYTNGTIIPNKKHIPHLTNDKVLVIITDYGVLSKKLNELKQLLEENRIAYYVLKPTEWLDCSTIAPHNRTIYQNREIFKICCAKNMATLSDGKLFRCPYAANAARLSAVPDYKSDYVDIFQEPLDAVGIQTTKNKIRDYILHKDYLQTCEYCNGRPLSGNEIPPAIQTNKPVGYYKYIN